MEPLDRIKDRFKEARQSFAFWSGQYDRGRTPDDLIAAAQEWGIMCGLAAAALEMGDNDLTAEIDATDPRLFPHEYLPSKES